MSLHDLVKREASAQTARLATARFGLVTAVDPVAHAVKVTIQPESVESGWIPDPGFAAGSLRISSPCEVGTQVLVTPVEGDAEHPVVTGRVFDAEVSPASSPYTGKPAQPGEYLIAAGQQGAPESNAQAVQNPAWFHVTPTAIALGAGTVQLVLSGSTAVLSIGTTMFTFAASGLLVAGGDVTASGISLDRHVHTGVQSGTSTTGLPEG